MGLICNGREILQCKPNIKNGEWGLKLQIIGYDWRFGDMCQWKGNRCVVVGILHKEEKECQDEDYYVVIALEDATLRTVIASKLLPAFKENTIDGYVIKSDCEHFFNNIWNFSVEYISCC